MSGKKIARKNNFPSSTESAAGLRILANIIMVATLVALEAVPLTQEDLAETIRQTFPAPKMEINMKALQMGVEAIQIEVAKYKDG